MEQPISHQISAYLDYLQTSIDEAVDQLSCIKLAFDTCESPIEQQLLLAYLDQYPTKAYHDIPGSVALFDEETLNRWVCFVPQFPLRLNKKRYRADFLFWCMAETEGGGITVDKTVVVEVDGHDFHERTKEQARNDKARDRLMVRHGFYVLRYTGSEVFTDPHGVAKEIREFVMPVEAAA